MPRKIIVLLVFVEFVFILNETRMRLLSALDDVQHLTFDTNASLQLDRNVIFF